MFVSKITKISHFIGVFILTSFTLQASPFEEHLKLYDRDDIHSIHKRLYTKEGRHEVSANIGGIMNNNGYMLGNFQYTYHLFESLGIEAMNVGMAFSPDNNAEKLYFYQASLAFSPIYGKVSFLTWAVLNFDIYAIGGLGMARYEGVTDGSSFMGNIGLGQRFFVNEFCMNLEQY